MQKTVIKNDTTVVVVLNGTSYQRENLTDEEFNIIVNSEDEDEIISIMVPEIQKVTKERRRIESLINRINQSKILTMDGDSIYWQDVSELSIPEELAEAVLNAEFSGDNLKLETYKNFWTLMSLNPSEECRKNLFWFLNRNGLVISRCGFFVAYRNVCKTNEEGVFTDERTHSFKISIGNMVTMPREKCDCDSNVTCSKGLHLGARTWLKENYFGDTGLVCLCNPAEVVAVPHEDHYGKLRTCAYLPIDFAQFDFSGDVIPYDVSDGFECEYVPKVIYEGLMGTEEDSSYKIIIPDIPGVNKNKISNSLLDIALKCIANRVK